MNDSLQRYLFDGTDIRGELTRLHTAYRDILSAHPYPAAVARLLGEFLAAASLLSATLKFEGTLTLQAKSEGEIPLIMAEITSDRRIRGIARGADAARSENFHDLLRNGQLAITVAPSQGQRYQGIVPLDGDSLAACLEFYFRQSEQLATRIWLAADEQQCAGMLLQELPADADSHAETRSQQWQHITTLADTTTPAELLQLPFHELLHRLYHQDPVRLFEPEAVSFQCSCSADRTLSALSSFGEAELRAILAEHGAIDVNCEFCHQHYHFTEGDIDSLFSNTLH